MPYPLKYNTASQEVPLGHFLDSTNGNDEETGLTIANTDIKLHKAGGTSLINKNSGGGTHMSNGVYYAVMDDTDTNTYGPLTIFVHVAGALAVKLECVVMNALVYDSLYGTDKQEVDLIQMGGVAQSATDLKDFADAGYDPATNKVEGVKLADTTTTNTDMVGTDGANTTTPPTVAEIQTELEEDGDSLLDTIRDELANGTDGLSALKTLIDAIPTTAMRGTDNAALASVTGALNDVAADGDPTDADTLMQYLKQLINILIGTAGIVAFPAEGAPANAVSLAEVIRAIHVDVTGLNGDAMRGTNSANTTVPDAAGVAATPAEVATALTTYDGPTKAEMDTAHALLATVAKQDVIDGIVDAILLDTGTDGVILKAAGLNADAVDEFHDEIIEGTTTHRQAIRLILAVLCGKSTGGGTVSPKMRDTGDTKNRVEATVDANGNRTAMTLDGT